MVKFIEHRDYKHPHWLEIDNPHYKIGSHTFDYHGEIRIDGVIYNMDCSELRMKYHEACMKRTMWSQLNVRV